MCLETNSFVLEPPTQKVYVGRSDQIILLNNYQKTNKLENWIFDHKAL